MNKKFQRIIMIIYVLSLIVMLSGATYAYFTLVKVSSVSPEIEVSSATTNFIIFDSGNPIRITPDSDNFGVGMGNLSETTFASAYVRVAEGFNTLSYRYNLFLDIKENNLEYSTASGLPELILTVTDPFGNEVTAIDGLSYVTVNGISGFDITKATGRYYIAYNYIIETNSELLHKWDSKITFVNLGESQDRNLEKKLEGVIQIEKAD